MLLGSVGVGNALPPCSLDKTEHYHNCFGTFPYADGSISVGGWRDDRKNGRGTKTYANGAGYVCEWRDDEKQRGYFVL